MATDEPAPDAGSRSDEDADLDELADAILDGKPVDWQRAASGSPAPLLDELRQIAGLADAHRNLSDEDATTSPSGPSGRREPPAPPIGRWGGLLLLERIGSGAFGEVFRAWDPRLDREVALKLLHAPAPASAETADEVVEEGRLLARVRHPNVAAIYGAERADGRVGVWTEFVRGRTLAEETAERGRFDAAEAAAIGVDLCRALAAAHDAGVLHRDVKPQNVMREAGGRLVLVDFGASRDGLPGSPSQTGDTAGTPLYVAPELWEGEPASPQSDVYSVGVLLFHLVTGTYPTPGATLAEVRDAHRQGQPPRRLADERPDLPAAFVRVVERAIATAPDARYAGAAELEAALDAARQRPVRRRRRVQVAVGVVAAAGAIALLAYTIGTILRPTAELSTAVTTTLITFRVPEDAVLRAAISPDGRLLALVDDAGLSIQELAGGDIQRVPIAMEPADILDLAWQADSAGLFVAARDGIWRTWVEPAKPVRILEGGSRIASSPDGRWIAVSDGGRIRVATTAGGDERVVAGPEPGATFGKPRWSPDGGRLGFGVTRWQRGRHLTIETRRVDGSDPTVVLEWNPGSLVAWAADGRMLLSRPQPPPRQRNGDLWTVAVNASGRRVGEPVRRVPGADLQFVSSSITADGKRLVVIASPGDSQTHTATFDPAGPSLGEFRRAVQEQFRNRPIAWTPDGAGVVLFMDRGERGFRVYLQLLDRRLPGPLLPRAISDLEQAVFSPDGRWILYPSTRQPGGVVRVPADGGEPRTLFGPASYLALIKCAYPPAHGCVLADVVGSPLDTTPHRFTKFDPDTGTAGQSFELPPAALQSSFDLSPDARYVAVVVGAGPENRRLLVLDLETGSITERAPAIWRGLEALTWAREGLGLIVVRRITEDTNEMLYVDDRDRVTPLWKGTHSRVMMPAMSPDGRTLAFALGTRNPNVWMVQGF